MKSHLDHVSTSGPPERPLLLPCIPLCAKTFDSIGVGSAPTSADLPSLSLTSDAAQPLRHRPLSQVGAYTDVQFTAPCQKAR